jgi:NADPH:quinone reductase-like Zn-dependent oxidoreductase
VLRWVFGLMSLGILRRARQRNIGYDFHFVRPDGRQLAAIGQLLEVEKIKPVIDKVCPFAEAKTALTYLAQGRAKGKVVISMLG